MKACNYGRHGAPSSVVTVSDIPSPPEPSAGEVLVKVSASSLNPADWKSAKGEQALLLSFKWPRIYGFDFSGVVVKVEDSEIDVDDGIKVGVDVFGMIAGLPQRDRGTLAEYILVPRAVCAVKPQNIAHIDAAAVPLVSITAFKMFEACRIKKGADVLITGGAGGMGTAAIQIAKCKFGAKVRLSEANRQRG